MISSPHAWVRIAWAVLCAGTIVSPRPARAQLPQSKEFDKPAEGFRYEQRVSENGTVPPNAIMVALADVEGMGGPRTAGITSMNWFGIGPDHVGGRVRSILIHPTEPNKMWVGSVGGGIWKTTDGGASWQVINDFLPGLAIGCMAMDPVNPLVMYAGTGEGFFNGDSLPGVGILKSTDGGDSWAQIASTIPANLDPTLDDWGYVNRIAISPTDSLIILAATNKRIFRTTNGGTSWSSVFTGRTLDLDFDPTNSNRAVAGRDNRTALYSVTGGATWLTAGGFPTMPPLVSPEGRVELAYAPGDPTKVYASLDINGGEVWRSENGGQTYLLRNTGQGYLGNQGWYDNAIWVDPTVSSPIITNTIIVGGIDLWRSIDGGTTINRISQWQSAPLTSAHADNHLIVSHPFFEGTLNRTVYFANDGGIYRTDDVYNVDQTSGWVNLNNGLGITQFYGAAANSASGVIIGGTQDNGTLRTEDYVTWTDMFGGDGGFCAIDPIDPNYMYGEYVYCSIHRSMDAGLSSDFVVFGGTRPLEDALVDGNLANFISPFMLDPNNSDRLLAGTIRLWRSNNIRTLGNPDWFSIKGSNGSKISAIAVAQGNSDMIWVGHNNGDVYKTVNGTLAAPTWTKVDGNPTALPNRYCTRILIDPTNANRIYATFSGYAPDNVWTSANAGATWTKITGPGIPPAPNTLPRAPVNSIVLHPLLAGWLYVGTDIGVFASEDFGATWSSMNDGPANVAVDELIWKGLQLIAVTHGRGMFQADLCPTISITPNSLPTGIVGVAYNQTLVANGGNLPYTWTISSGALPDGLTLSSAGDISGTPTISGIFTFTAKVTDFLGCVSFKVFTVPTTCGPTPASFSETPPRNSALITLDAVDIVFDKEVTQISPGTLRVNGSPATVVFGSGQGPFTFIGFDRPGNGAVTVSLGNETIIDVCGNVVPIQSWTYIIQDCNGNSVLDSQDVASSFSQDCNRNGIPDECDTTLLVADAGPDINIQLGDLLTLGSETQILGGAPPYTYQWILQANSASLTSSSPNPAFVPSAPGTYVVRLVVSDSQGCQSTSFLTILVNGGTVSPLPVADMCGNIFGTTTVTALAATVVGWVGVGWRFRSRRARHGKRS